MKPYDTLLADIARDWDPNIHRTPNKDAKHYSRGQPSTDEFDEWFGLDYVLQLSREETHTVRTENDISGEFSKVWHIFLLNKYIE